MKTFTSKLFISLVALAGLFSVAACSDDDDIKTDKVPANIRTEFAKMYPEATNVDWESKYGYYVADFKKGSLEMDAWYDEIGRWTMSVTDFDGQRPLISVLPEPVQLAIIENATEGIDYTVDDVHLYERIGSDIFYEVEVEGKIAASSVEVNDITYFYRPDGTLINSVENFKGEIIPTTVIADLK